MKIYEKCSFHYLMIDFIFQNGRQNVWFFFMHAASFYIHHIQGQVHNCQNVRILLTIYVITSLSGENCELRTVLGNKIIFCLLYLTLNKWRLNLFYLFFKIMIWSKLNYWYSEFFKYQFKTKYIQFINLIIKLFEPWLVCCFYIFHSNI